MMMAKGGTLPYKVGDVIGQSKYPHLKYLVIGIDKNGTTTMDTKFHVVKDKYGYADLIKDGRMKVFKGGMEEQKKFVKEEYAKGGVARDAARFAKPKGWRWKNDAVGNVELTPGHPLKKSALSKPPSNKARRNHPDDVAFENRSTKSDKKPYRKYKSL
jgi:hypothetical protein